MNDLVNVDIDLNDKKPSVVALFLASLIWIESTNLHHKPDYKLIRSYALKLYDLISENWHD